MEFDRSADKFRQYLKKIQDTKEDRCWFCNKTPHQIRHEFLEYMKNPSEEHEELALEDILIMTYKTKKPVCAGCYFAIKNSPELVEEILEKPEEEFW
jgi:hypothetical protein